MYVIPSKEITLSDELVTPDDRAALAAWIVDGGELAQGEHTEAFQKEVADFLGVRHAIMVNSGASANLMIAYALKEGRRLRNMRAVAPALCRATAIAPLMQLGFQITLCDCDEGTFNVDVARLEEVLKAQDPAVLVLPHMLGTPCYMDAILDLCRRYNVILIEDSRDAFGGQTRGRKLGTFGTAASFSLRSESQLSTVEGGMIVTDDDDLHQLLLSLRGQARWDGINNGGMGRTPAALHAGFRLNGSEFQAFLGRRQMPRLQSTLSARARNVQLMHQALGPLFCQEARFEFAPCIACGLLVRNRMEIHAFLKSHRIESRMMIATNIARLPFWHSQNGMIDMTAANKVHDMGMVLPVHAGLSELEIVRIADMVLKVADAD